MTTGAKTLSVNLIVLNYNGRDLLERFLPSVFREAAASAYPCKVTVIDNSSQDGSAEFVRSRFPQADLVELPNRVLSSFNDAVRPMTEDIVFLLNNDMELLPGFVDPLVKVFEEHPDAFFSASHGNRAAAAFRWGILEPDTEYPGHRAKMEEAGITFSAGVAAFDRKKFLELGGYDPLFIPGRYEDVDLSWRGWKRGWKGYYVPECRQIHIGGESFNRRFGWKRTQRLVFRNSILFMVKNIQDGGLWARFAAFLPLRLLWAALTGKGFILAGFADAVKRLPEAVAARREVRRHFVLKDREVIAAVNRDIPRQSASVRSMRAFVELIGKNAALRKLFFWLGFPTVRLAFPVQFLLLRELIGCESVLDLGCGKHSMVPIIPSRIRKVGVEYFKPAYEEAARKARHEEVIHADVAGVDFEEKSFDAVVLLDVIEHLPKEEGLGLLEKMERWAKQKVIVFTPNGFLRQGHYDENPLMEHRSGWTTAEFKSRGFRVRGVRGFKTLKKGSFDHDHDAKPGFWGRLADVTQIVTYHFPESAYQLFCVKEIGILRPAGRRGSE